jgi:hypothetical protein
MNSSKNNTIRKLIREGHDIKDVCDMLGMDIDAANFALLQGDNREEKRVNINELCDEFKPRCIEILKEIAENSERDADRIKACQIIIQGEGVMPETNMNDFSDRLIKMRRAMGEIIEISESNNQCSPQLAIQLAS